MLLYNPTTTVGAVVGMDPDRKENDALANDALVNDALVCNVCSMQIAADQAPPFFSIRSNSRKFQNETFVVWRCPQCQSIHTRDKVDLDYYYRDYPIFGMKLVWGLRLAYANLLKRLTRAGLKRSDDILDYGCGGGTLVQYLGSRKYNAVGYDAYSEGFQKREVLARQYPCVIAHDVLEHVEEPLALLETLGGLTAPGGLVAIGMPDAAGIDLANPEEALHALHLPFHRHILSAKALHDSASALGWTTVRHYETPIGNTLVPLNNLRFYVHYLLLFDNTLELAFDPVPSDWRLLSPVTLFYALFGYFFCPKTDVMTIFRVPPS